MNWKSLFTIVILLFFAAPLEAKSYRILIDPGHGGTDHGAVANNNKESLITLSVAKKLKSLFDSDAKFSSELSRQADEYLGLAERVRKGRELGADLILSVHVNWSSDPRAKGVEVYFQNQLPPDEESMFLAARENKDTADNRVDPSWLQIPQKTGIHNSEVDLILQDLHRNVRILQSSQLARIITESWQGDVKSKAASIQQAPFFVISNNLVPSVLVEIGFLTHSIEGPKLGTDAYQWIVAKTLYAGITKFYETIDKAPRSRLE